MEAFWDVGPATAMPSPYNDAHVPITPDGKGIWFHDLPPLATIHGAIVATDIGTSPAGMVMVLP